MAFEEGGERIQDLKLICDKASEVATLFDTDGILVRFMNSTVEGNGIRCAACMQACSVLHTGGPAHAPAARPALDVLRRVAACARSHVPARHTGRQGMWARCCPRFSTPA